MHLSLNARRDIGCSFTPYRIRTTNNLLFTAKLIKQREDPLPFDLITELNKRGIEVSSI